MFTFLQRAACLLLLSIAGTATAEVVIDDWYVMSLMDSPAGWMNVMGDVQEDGHRRLKAENHIELKRGAMTVSVSTQVEWVETSEGAPVSMTMRQDMSGQRVTTVWTFDGSDMEITTEQGGRWTTTTGEVPDGTWYPTWAMMDEMKRRIKAGETEFSLHTMMPDQGIKLVEVTFKKLATEPWEDDGVKSEVTLWEVTNNAIPFTSTQIFNADLKMISNTMEAPFGDVVMILMKKRRAVMEVLKGAAELPELLESLTVPVDRPIPGWKTARNASFRLIPRTGDVPSLPSAGFQRVGTVAEDGTLVVDVDLDAPSIASAEDQANPAYLGTSVLIDPTDPAILKMAGASLEEAGDDPARKADVLREAVFSWISRKDYGTVFASASETVRNRTGDCSEHGVLLAALLRSEGIPARVASGAVYVPAGVISDEPVFGWHMWTQAIIDGHWVDLDATLPVSYTVGHLLADTSSLADDGGVADQWNLLSMMGNLKVDVLSVDGASLQKP